MANEKISPRYITKPIQLLAGWLVGLTSVVGIFLAAAAHLPNGGLQIALVIASIIYVPMFLFTMFVLQTRFRDELQEDAYYARMVKNRKTDTVVAVSRIDALEAKVEACFRDVTLRLQSLSETKVAETSWSNWKIALNSRHPQYQDIKAAFIEAKIPVAVAFGTSSAPTKWIVAINENMSKDLALIILRIIAHYRFDGFVFWNPVRDVGETEDVYVGSYGQGPYTTIEPDFMVALTDELTLSEYMVAHQKD